MKVLQVLPSLDVGGVERGVLDLARGMKKRGEQTVVLSSGGELTAELQKMGVPHYTLPVQQKSLFSLALVPRIAEIIQRERIDLVHARSRVPAWLAWLAACRTGIPFVTTCHGYYSAHPLSHVMGWGKLVIVISRVVGRHMIDDFRVPPEKIRLVHRGIDLSQFVFSPQHYDKKPGVHRIINVGRFSPIKGQLEFVRAVHFLRRKLPNIEAWLVGGEARGKTKYTTEIEKTIRQLGLEQTVKLMGVRRDIPELLGQSDLLVLSTLAPEAFGRVIVEAGAVGTAVLSTRVGGVLDILDHNENGFLVPPGDIIAMAEGMYEVLTDRERSKKFAANLRKKVETQFLLEKMVSETIAVYEEIERQKKILILKLGAIGDLILITPSLRMIRRRFPEAKISLVVDKKLAAIVSGCPYVNEVIPVSRDRLSKIGYLLRLAKTLRKEGYDISVDLQNNKWTHLLAALGGIPQRYGFRRGKLGFLVNRHDRSFDIADYPVRHQFRILSKLGIQDLDEDLELWPDEHSEKHVSEMFVQHSLNGSSKCVGLAVGASPKWTSKRWPLEYYQELCTKLIQQWKCSVILIGSETDRPMAQQLSKTNTEKVVDLVGKTSLLDLVSVVKRLSVLVTGDTAPLHIAAAVKTPVVTLFGPTEPKRHVPPGENVTVLSRHIGCQPCYQGECPEKDVLACLKK
ncbi:MAG: lipopolysaccharide heptosyltransferase II, partial [Candidatus Omnitrophica bacterium]|nr:lipopolysaccharide heptosyltransferase II [Candidatus Omnitrophota bacterium]